MKKVTICKLTVSILTVISLLIISPLSLVSSALGASPNGSASKYVYIRNVKSGKYMDLPGGIASNGKEVKLYHSTQSKAQQWYVDTSSGSAGYCIIRSAVNENYILAVQNDSNTDGAKLVVVYNPDFGVPDGALFLYQDGSELGMSFLWSYMSFRGSSTSIRAIQPSGGGTADGTNLVMWRMPDTLEAATAQMWVFESTSRSVKTSGWNLVDSGKHCDWDGNSKYLSFVKNAASAWNSNAGTTIFREDAFTTLEDIWIHDEYVHPTNPKVSGSTRHLTIRSEIVFYTSVMENLESNVQRQKVAMHELGHALGLDENNDRGNIMSQGYYAYGTSLSLDDKASYIEAAKNYK